MMLELNPKDRPDIKTILSHPYFTYSPESSPDVANPFTSPLGTPERVNPMTHNVFTDPAFGSVGAPSFGSSQKSVPYDMDMECSPGTKSRIVHFEESKNCKLLISPNHIFANIFANLSFYSTWIHKTGQ
jgi:hypothetical protein